MNRKSKTILWITLGVVGLIVIGILFSDIINPTETLSWTEFMTKLASGEINKVYIDAYNWTGYAGTEKVFETV
ncbi:MAG: hypothetical protein E7343_01590, partial [Clostridiales bacterium]|nr:hypothetical protein [Clostridiales bacterium]